MQIYVFAFIFFALGILSGYGIGLHPGKNFLQRAKNYFSLRKTFTQKL